MIPSCIPDRYRETFRNIILTSNFEDMLLSKAYKTTVRTPLHSDHKDRHPKITKPHHSLTITMSVTTKSSITIINNKTLTGRVFYRIPNPNPPNQRFMKVVVKCKSIVVYGVLFLKLLFHTVENPAHKIVFHSRGSKPSLSRKSRSPLR
jgi:hypothetical protein